MTTVAIGHATVWGAGDRVVLVHGSITTGVEAWAQQRPLADAGFQLVVPDRRGYGVNAADVEGEDYEIDAQDIARLLEDGAHVVGHSYGGIGALLAAAAHPDRVRSLVVIEPPAFGLAAGHPAVASLTARSRALWARPELTDRAFLEGFLDSIGVPLDELPEDLLHHWTRQTAPLRHCRPPWDAQIPLASLASARIPTLVVSGGHHEAFDATSAALADAIGAEYAVVRGAGHEVPATGQAFNDVLLEFWAS